MTSVPALVYEPLPNIAALRVATAVAPPGQDVLDAATFDGGTASAAEPIASAALVATGAASAEIAMPTISVAAGALPAAAELVPEITALAPFRLRAAALVHAEIVNLALQLRAGTDFPRSESQVPISPVDPPTDTVLFEEPSDPARKLFLPRYELALRAANQYAVAFEDRGTAGWALPVALRPVSPPGLAVDGAHELPHTASLVLTYQHPGGGQRELAFEPAVRNGDELRAELRLPDMPSRDAAVRALSDPAAGARLVVRRAFDVAVPAPVGETPPWAPEFPDHFSAVEARAAMLGRPPDSDSDTQSEPPHEPLFRRSPAVLDVQVGDVFTFDRAVHPYIFAAVLGAAPGGGNLVTHRVAFGGRTHRYFQDPHHRNLFYYLPDEFRIPRDDRGSHAPMLRVRVAPAPDRPDGAAIVTDYVAVAVVDPARLADAAVELAPKVPQGLGAPQFERFEVRPDRLSYRVRLPRAGAGVADTVVGDEASLALSSIKHTFVTSIDEFQAIYAAIRGAVTTMFEGMVDLTLDGDAKPERIPVLTRAEDFAGDLFAPAAPVKVSTAAGADVTLRNLVECPIRLRDVTAVLVVDGVPQPADVSGGDATAEIEVKPGGALVLHVAPATGAEAAAGEVRISAQAELLPDGEALWNAILDPTSSSAYRRELTIRGEFLFGEPDPQDPIVGYQIEFDAGDTLLVTRQDWTVKTELRMPVKDFVLQDPNAPSNGGTFKYRCRPVHLPAREVPAGAWRPGTFPLLIPIAS